MVGEPATFRIGDAATEHQAMAKVREVIGCALDVQEAGRFVDPKQQS